MGTEIKTAMLATNGESRVSRPTCGDCAGARSPSHARLRVRWFTRLSLQLFYRGVRFSQGLRPRETVSLNGPLSVDHVRALLEGGGKSRERRVEHRAHQCRQHPAPELIGDEEA